MDPLHISILEHDFSSPRLPRSIPKKIVDFLSKVKFDGERIISTFNHICQFNHKCKSHKISNDNEFFKLFPLIFSERIKGSFKALLANYIHTWKQFMGLFLNAHQNYDHDQLCDEIES